MTANEPQPLRDQLVEYLGPGGSLKIGAGTGYNAALLAQPAGLIWWQQGVEGPCLPH